MRNFCFLLIAAFVLTTSFAAKAEIGNFGRGNRVTDEMTVGEGVVKGAVITDESQLIGGPKAEGLVGDFVIYNNRVGFVICGTRPTNGWSPMGGVVEDAGVIIDGPDGRYWWNVMGEDHLVLYRGSDAMFSGRVLAPVKAELLKDGSGGEAIVRILARDAEFDLREETTGVSSSSMKVKVMVDYILRPDTNVLEIKVTAINGKSKKNVIGVGKILTLGDTADIFVHGRGFDRGRVDGVTIPFYAADAGSVSYGWFASKDDVTIQAKLNAIYILGMDTLKIPSKGEDSLSVYLAAGAGGIDSVYRAYYEQRKVTDVGYVTGTLSDASGVVSNGASVSLLNSAGEIINRAYPDANGVYEMVARPGKYSVQAWSFDRALPSEASVEIKTGKKVVADIEMGLPAVLDYHITGKDGSTIPGMISFKKTGGDDVPDRKFIDDRNAGGFYKNYFTVEGKGAVEFRPGKYDVYISRGLEYEYAKMSVDVKAGEHVSFNAMLERAIDANGFLTGDFHVHSTPSFDTSDTIAEKVRTAYINGLEIPIATDHNMRTDYNPTIKELGLEKYVKSIIGCELTTMRRGHFNTFPLIKRDGVRNYGATDYMGRLLPDVFDDERADSNKRVVLQINHPRVPGAEYFGFMQYDPETGTAADRDNFTTDFDVIEVLNSEYYQPMEEAMIDWFSFLNRGMNVAASGNSDSHRVYNIQLGYPMNYVRSSTDIAGDMVESEFIDSIIGQHMTVSGGSMVLAEVNGEAEMGELITDKDGEVEIKVDVYAPTWIEVNKLTIYANGKEVVNKPIEMNPAPHRYTETLTLKADSDTWFVVRVDGDKDLFPVYPGRHAVAFTNPIYVDTDGNGKYDAPLSF